MNGNFIIAIDFGTTQTAVIAFKKADGNDSNIGELPEPLEITGCKNIPTALQLNPEGEVLHFGQKAMEALQKGENTFYNFKPYIGRDKLYDKYSADELALKFLTFLRKKIEEALNVDDLTVEKDIRCFIGCPTEWDELRKEKLQKIAQKAGFPKVKLCDEAKAVIFYYNQERSLEYGQNILVYDFGGGTVDLAVEQLCTDGENKILAAGGDHELGGMYFDDLLYGYMKGSLFTKYEIEETKFPKGDCYILKVEANKLKEMLSNSIRNGEESAETDLYLDYFTYIPVSFSLQKGDFESVCSDYIKRFESPIYKAISEAGLTKDKINQVLLAGGSSQMPYVKEHMERIFPGKVLPLPDDITSIVVKGLAIYGAKQIAGGGAKVPLLSDAGNVVQHPAEDNVMLGREIIPPINDNNQPAKPPVSERVKKNRWLPIAAAAVVVITLCMCAFMYISAENARHRQQIASMQDSLDQTKSAYNDVQSELEQTRSAYNDMQSELERTRSAYNETQDSLEQARSAYNETQTSNNTQYSQEQANSYQNNSQEKSWTKEFLKGAATELGSAGAGAVAGAAIGSVIPVIGTTVGGIIGAIAGSAGAIVLNND